MALHKLARTSFAEISYAFDCAKQARSRFWTWFSNGLFNFSVKLFHRIKWSTGSIERGSRGFSPPHSWPRHEPHEIPNKALVHQLFQGLKARILLQKNGMEMIPACMRALHHPCANTAGLIFQDDLAQACANEFC